VLFALFLAILSTPCPWPSAEDFPYRSVQVAFYPADLPRNCSHDFFATTLPFSQT
jgi:hypothetical protein